MAKQTEKTNTASNDARVIIATTVAEMERDQKDGDTKVGSHLLDGASKLAALVASGAAEVSVGADYMLAITNAQRAAKDQPLYSKPDEVSLAPRYGVVKLMRAAKDKPWFAAFMTNVGKLHNARPITVTVLTEFGHRLMPKKGEVKTCPTVDMLKQWRVDILKGKKTNKGKRKAKDIQPGERIADAASALQGFDAWLPADAQAHAMRCLVELNAIADILKAAPKPKAEPKVIDPIAALMAKLKG